MSPRRIAAPSLAALAILVSPAAMVNPAVAQQPSPDQLETIRQTCRSDFISHCSGVQPGGREAFQCLQRNFAKLSPACSSAINAIAPSPEPSLPANVAAPQPQQSLPSEQDQLSAVRQACTLDDLLSHCSWIQPTSPELLLCLRANEAQLSPGCQTAVRTGPAVTTPPSTAAPAVVAPPPPKPADVVAPPPAAAPAKTAARRPTSKQISAIRAVCRSDFISRCSGVQPGSSAALQCLERHKTEVAQPCQDALAALSGTATGAETNPEQAKSSVTSPTATESFPVRRLRPREELATLRACAPDARDLCGSTPRGGGRIIACLARNSSRLTSQCRAALAEARR